MIVHEEPSLFAGLLELLSLLPHQTIELYDANSHVIWAVVLFLAIFTFIWILFHPKKATIA
jgi:hypothetical protein